VWSVAARSCLQQRGRRDELMAAAAAAADLMTCLCLCLMTTNSASLQHTSNTHHTINFSVAQACPAICVVINSAHALRFNLSGMQSVTAGAI